MSQKKSTFDQKRPGTPQIKRRSSSVSIFQKSKPQSSNSKLSTDTSSLESTSKDAITKAPSSNLKSLAPSPSSASNITMTRGSSSNSRLSNTNLPNKNTKPRSISSNSRMIDNSNQVVNHAVPAQMIGNPVKTEMIGNPVKTEMIDNADQTEIIGNADTVENDAEIVQNNDRFMIDRIAFDQMFRNIEVTIKFK